MEKNLVLATKNANVKSYGGFKVLTHFGGIAPQKHFIEGITKHSSSTYILNQRLILYKMADKQTTLGLKKKI